MDPIEIKSPLSTQEAPPKASGTLLGRVLSLIGAGDIKRISADQLPTVSQESKEQLQAVMHQLGARVDTDPKIQAIVRAAEEALKTNRQQELQSRLTELRLETDHLENS